MPEIRSIAGKSLVGAWALLCLGAGFALWRHAVRDEPIVHRLADGTIVSFAADTRVVPARGFPLRRDISLNGRALLEVPVARRPLVIRTRLMRVEVIRPSTLLVTARWRQSGEEVDVLEGEVIVRKNYLSNHRKPDDLHAGQLSMVNRTIDLMEKEPIGAASIAKIRAWAKTLK